MRLAFVVLGLLWLGLAAGVATGSPWAWAAGLALAVCTIWYLVPGTVIGLAVVLLLLTPPVRRSLGRG
jgi:ABC-type Fe3+ transport system permease subunit